MPGPGQCSAAGELGDVPLRRGRPAPFFGEFRSFRSGCEAKLAQATASAMLAMVRAALENSMEDPSIRDAKEAHRVNAQYRLQQERLEARAHPLRTPRSVSDAFFQRQKDAAGAAGSKYRATSTSRANCLASVLELAEAEIAPPASSIEE